MFFFVFFLFLVSFLDPNFALFADSPFSPNWFGSYGEASSGYQVLDGAFANWPIATVDDVTENGLLGRMIDEVEPLLTFNAWGLQRSGFNLNDSPILTRAHGWVGLDLSTAYQWTPETEFAYYAWLINEDAVMRKSNYYPAHAWAHQWNGGAWTYQDHVDLGTDSLLTFEYDRRMGVPLFEQNCFTCPEPGSCNGLTREECKCTSSPALREASPCAEFISSSYSTDNAALYSAYVGFSSEPADTPTKFNILGDLADAWSAPNDPLFWSIHSFIDRELYFYQYVNYKRAEKYHPEEPIDLLLGLSEKQIHVTDLSLVCGDLDQPLEVSYEHGPVFTRGDLGFNTDPDEWLLLRDYMAANVAYLPENWVVVLGDDADEVDIVVREHSWFYEVPENIEGLIDNSTVPNGFDIDFTKPECSQLEGCEEANPLNLLLLVN
jgi:hypothetical protein